MLAPVDGDAVPLVRPMVAALALVCAGMIARFMRGTK